MSRSLVWLVWVLLAVGCQGGGAPSASAPAAPRPGGGEMAAPDKPAVALTAPATPVAVGHDVSVALATQAARNLYAVALTLTYDPAQVTYVGQVEGDLLNRDGAPTAVEVAEADDAPGRLLVGLTRVGDVGGVSGAGVLVTLIFHAAQPGQAQIQVAEATATLRDADDAPLPVADWRGVVLTIR